MPFNRAEARMARHDTPGRGSWWAAALAACWLCCFLWLLAGLNWHWDAPPAPPDGNAYTWLTAFLNSHWIPGCVALLLFAVGLLAPAAWFALLGLMLALFGNNPGGPHQLYWLEAGLLGLNVRYWAARARGTLLPAPRAGDAWLHCFVAWSLLTVWAQWRYIWVEIHFAPLTALATLLSHYGTSPNFGAQMGLKLALAWGLYLYLRDVPWPLPRLARYWQWLLLALLASAVAGLLEYAGLLSLTFWRGVNPDLQRFGFRRLQSLYWHSGWYAQYLVALAPAAVALALTAPRGLVRAGWWLVAVVLALATLLTMQRAGWLALGGGCMVVVLLALLRARRAGKGIPILRLALPVAGLLVLGGVVALAVPAFRERLGELGLYQHRSAIWSAALALWSRHPLVGSGLGNFYTEHLRWLTQPPHYNLADKVGAHNLWLQIGTERGFIGLGLFCGFLWHLCLRLHRGWREPTAHRRWLWLALAGGLAGLCIDGLFQEIFYVRTIDLLFWLMAGWTTLAPATPVTSPWLSWRVRAVNGALAMLLGLWLIYRAHWLWIGPFYVYEFEHFPETRGRRAVIHIREPVGFTLVRLNPPGRKQEPVTYTFIYQGRVIHQPVITEDGPHQYIFDPQGQRGKLEITTSLVYEPLAYGWRQYPVAQIGVLLVDPQPVPFFKQMLAQFNKVPLRAEVLTPQTRPGDPLKVITQ